MAQTIITPPSSESNNINYDNTTSGLQATDVQSAIDEVALNSGGNYSQGDGIIISNDTISTDLKSTTKSSLTAESMGSTANRQYAVGLDTNGNLSVNIPWSNVNSDYQTSTISSVTVGSSSYTTVTSVIEALATAVNSLGIAEEESF